MEGAEEHGREAQAKSQSIYKAARAIKRRQNTLYNALRSIYEDSIFVKEISQLWPRLPVLANLRCGLWYSPTFDATCYFKSTDGHCNNWSFNTSRLNLHAALLAGQKGGCVIVDSTRKGKRFPDSMSKTIPIWTCVMNRAIHNYRKLHDEHASTEDTVNLVTCNAKAETMKPASPPWDLSLHLPLWVSKTEKSSIEDCLEEWARNLESCGADIALLAKSLRKPLRPLWISQKSIIWLNEVPDHDSWDFTPIILLSASSSTGFCQQRTSSEFSWNYIPGAGDDEESWARGLTPGLFWRNLYDLLNMSPDTCNRKVAEIVEKDRVYRAHRGEETTQIGIRPQLNLTLPPSNCEATLCSELSRTEVQSDLRNGEDRSISWLGSTNVAVGTTQLAASEPEVDCILNCDKEILALGSRYTYMQLPTVNSKFNRFSLLSNLPSAIKFAKTNLSQGKTLLVCCHDGEDISVCVCLAILMSLFDENGSYDARISSKEMIITKLEMRRRLVYICKFATGARPSRGNLKQVFSFVNGGTVVNSFDLVTCS